jgi:hypothetical protein
MIAPQALARLQIAPTPAMAPEGFTAIDSAIRQGMPHPIPLAGNQRLLLIAPSGVATTWRDEDAATVVSAGAWQRTASAVSPQKLDIAKQMPLRVLYQINGKTLAVVPLAIGPAQRLATDDGVKVDLLVLDWVLHVGALRGPGDFGSRIALAWRAADRAVERFSDPPLNPVFVQRQPPERKLQSHLGRVKLELNPRFSYKKALRRVVP